VAVEVATGLLFLHKAPRPIVHMDLKPGNILLSKDRVPVTHVKGAMQKVQKVECVGLHKGRGQAFV
jgi:serine/threonine protein kinase